MSTFADFLAVLRVRPTPAQRVYCAVAFDGADPRDLPPADRELAARMFGPVDVVPPLAREVIAQVKGARIGGTMLAAYRMLSLALTVSLDTMARGERASALIVAPDLRLARQALRYALGAAKGVPPIASAITSEGADSFVIRRPHDGRPVAIECLPATRGGSAVRGRSLVGAVLSECAFFRDSDFVVNDAELLRAIAPRILPGGQIVLESTPWAESGELYQLWSANHGAPSTALAAHCPTLLMRPDARTAAIVRRERERDPDNARREFDAEFLSGGAGTFLDAAAIEACVSGELVLPMPDQRGGFAGGDFGFRSDSSALAIVASSNNVLRVLHLAEQRPGRGAPLRPSAVCRDFAAIAKHYGCDSVCSDAHYSEAIREHLREHGIRLEGAPEGQRGKVESYLHFRRLIAERRIHLPRHARLIAQLKSITARATSGGSLVISSPRIGGAHGDLVSALVLAAWHASQSSRQGYRGPLPPLLLLGDSELRDGPPARSNGDIYDHAGSQQLLDHLARSGWIT